MNGLAEELRLKTEKNIFISGPPGSGKRNILRSSLTLNALLPDIDTFCLW